MSGLGRTLIIMGLMLVVAGLIISFAPRLPWLGKLPGDIIIRRENFGFYFPIGSCILISLIMTFILWLIRR